MTCWSDPFPLYSESRRIIPNSATAAASFKSLGAAEKSDPVSLALRSTVPIAASSLCDLSCSFAVNNGSDSCPATIGFSESGFCERNRAKVNRERAHECYPKDPPAVLSVKQCGIHKFPLLRKTRH